jgi:hypothetical protein
MIDASNEEDIKLQKSNALRLQELRGIDLANVLSTESGRRFLWNLLLECQTFSTEFYGNSRDAFTLGKRTIGTFLQGEIIRAVGFKMFDTMKQEFEDQLKGGEKVAKCSKCGMAKHKCKCK